MSLIEEASKCNNCLCWHKHCKAECCKQILIHVSPVALQMKGKYLVVPQLLTPDAIWYYKLHGVIAGHGQLKFDKSKCIAFGDDILYVRTCSNLDGLLCTGHPDNKPLICKELTMNHCLSTKYHVTPNCLFKYKQGVEQNEKNKSTD